jgi:hypothetical protein
MKRYATILMHVVGLTLLTAAMLLASQLVAFVAASGPAWISRLAYGGLQ